MVDKAELRQFITQYFSDLELDELCFDYYPDLLNQFTVGMTKSQKAIALIGYCERRGRMNHLLSVLSKLRSETYTEQIGLLPAQQPSAPAVGRNPDRVFLSHANQDIEFARQLATDLRRAGFDVWVAPDSIDPGEKWVDAINRGLETSGIFLLVMTPSAAASGWVRDETNFAIAQENKKAMRLIMLDVGEGQMPPLWSVRQHVTFRRDYDAGLQQLLATLRPDYPAFDPPTKLPPTSRAPDQMNSRVGDEGKLAKTAPVIAADSTMDGTPAKVVPRKPLYWVLGIVSLLAVTFIGWRLMAMQGNDMDATRTSTRTLLLTPAAIALPQPQAANSRIVERGGVEVAQVFVPAGSFVMGSGEGANNERPVHRVALGAFWIDQTEVTNAQFAAFVANTGYSTTAENKGGGFAFASNEWGYIVDADWQHPQGPASNLDGLSQHPVVLVSWDDATAFCEWSGGRLPAEAEWEYAARGPGSHAYPWGDAFDGEKLNYCDRNCPFDWADQGIDDGYKFTAPVGTYSEAASWFGALDMAGNVWEWVNDWYDSGYYRKSPGENPSGPASGDYRVLRGGAWSNYGYVARPAFRNSDFRSDDRDGTVGFRCVQE